MKIRFSILLLMLNLILAINSNLTAQPAFFHRLDKEIKIVQSQFAPDRRTAIFDVFIQDTLSQILTLKGETNIPEGKNKVINILKANNLQFVDSMRVLPDVSLGEKIWGMPMISVSNLRAKPDDASELVSQALMGTPMKLLDVVNGWYRVQMPDNYIGWMDGSSFIRLTQDEINSWKKSDRFIFKAISGYAFESPDKKSNIISDLVLGDIVETTGLKNGYLKIKTPDGRIGFVLKKKCISWKDWTNQKPNVESVIALARQMLGSPYLWGGTSTKAIDCSGFTKTAYFSQGIILARDASQQARYGQHPDISNIRKLHQGDLLFFGRNENHITHVGIYLGDGKYIHASGFVRISSIDPKDPDYNLSEKKKFITASRIMDSLNTDGIVLIKDHPWYNLP